MRTFMRAAAAALALSTLAACDTRRETSGLDDSPPEITQLSIQAQNDSVDINAPMKVTVEAFDNLSLQRIVIVVDGVRRDSIVFNAATPFINHTFDVPLAGVQSGSVIIMVVPLPGVDRIFSSPR